MRDPRSTKAMAYRTGETIHLRFRGWHGTFAAEFLENQIAMYRRLSGRSGPAQDLDLNVVRALENLRGST